MTSANLYILAAQIMASIVNAGSTADESDMLRLLKQKEWGDEPPPPQTFEENTVNNIKIGSDNVQNNIYNNDRTFYNTSIEFNFNLPEEVTEIPNRPRSRITIEDATENLGQSETAIVIGEPITLQKSIEQQKFGSLLWNPVQEKKQKVRQLHDSNLTARAEEYNNLGTQRYIKYLENYPLETDKPEIYDPLALIAPKNLRGLGGKLGVIFGADALRLIASNNTIKSNNIFIGVSDIIPSGYEIVYDTPIYSHLKSDFDALLVNPDNFDKISEILGISDNPINWQNWIKSGITATINRETGGHIPRKADNLLQVIKYISAQFFFRLGLEDYPFTVPANLNLEGNEDPEVSTEDLQSLTDLLEWSVRAFDGVLGEFPFKIKIEDNDLIQTGNQSLELSFPNLAETLAELTGKQLQQEADSKALLNIVLRILAETGTVKQQAIQNYYLASANQEYLGYKSEQKSKEVEFLFNPEVAVLEEKEQNLAKALEPKTLKVPIESNIDKNSLESQLAILVESARILKAQNWRGFRDRGNIKTDFINNIKTAANLIDSLGLNKENNLDEFLDSLEQGFSNLNATIDPNKPFGRERERRPKARNLSDNG